MPNRFSSNKSTRALLLTTNIAATNAARRVLGALAEEVVAVRSVAEVDDLGAFSLVVVDMDDLGGAELADVTSRVTASVASRLIVLSSEEWRTPSVATFVLDTGASAVLGAEPHRLERELFITGRKMLTGDIFGLSKYFTWGADSVELSLNSSSQRAMAVDFAEAYTSKLKVHSRVANHVVTALDELVSNGFFNARTDESGRRLYADLPRSQVVTLPEGQPVTIGLCTDGARLGVSVTDGYGSLPIAAIRSRLFGPGTRRFQVVRDSSGGAGIGLYQTVSAVSNIVFNLRPGSRTEVVAIFELTRRYRDYVGQPKSLSMFCEAALWGQHADTPSKPDATPERSSGVSERGQHGHG